MSSQPGRLAVSGLGARCDLAQRRLQFTVYSEHATRIEVWIYAQPRDAAEVARVPMLRDSTGRFTASVKWPSSIERRAAAVYYGYRAWGPNWPYDPAFTPGTEAGFLCDVDQYGNRFNPNKLLLDPYAREISHDPAPRLSTIDPNEYGDEYYSGPEYRALDTAPHAPKAVLLTQPPRSNTGSKPRRLLKDDILYELHIRGFTHEDATLPEALRGTYSGAAAKVDYLKQLGITAVELMPVTQFASEQNDDGDPRGDNYWGYMTLGYFAPNRRFAADRSPGGPTREFCAMVKTFHDAGIKVIVDVVYNHTGEGLLRRTTENDASRGDDAAQQPDRACLLSLRGLDNATYYTLRSRPDLDSGLPNQRYQDNSGCGPGLNTTHPVVQALIIDSLRYWADELGVDGFRFDLAPVLGNRLAAEGFEFDGDGPDSLLQRMADELPARRSANDGGVDLIAEPWAIGAGTYQLGHFPRGWAQWNDVYRSTLRRAENKLGVGAPLPGELANVFSGSDQQLRRHDRSWARPWQSINYIAAHDGFTLRDVYSYTGGDSAWDHGRDPARQRKAVRNAFALLMTSAGVPMFMAGDELFRTQEGIENAVALDNSDIHVDWTQLQRYLQAAQTRDTRALDQTKTTDQARMFEFAREMLHLRRRFGALRTEQYFTGAADPKSGLPDLGWYDASGRAFAAWSDGGARFLAFRIDTHSDLPATGVRSLYVGYNWNDADVEITLPQNLPGAHWFRRADTAEWMESEGNVDHHDVVIERSYLVHERSVVIFAEH